MDIFLELTKVALPMSWKMSKVVIVKELLHWLELGTNSKLKPVGSATSVASFPYQ